jgi:hypothetical protein
MSAGDFALLLVVSASTLWSVASGIVDSAKPPMVLSPRIVPMRVRLSSGEVQKRFFVQPSGKLARLVQLLVSDT